MAQTSTTTTAASSTNFKVSRQYNSEPWAILITLASIIIVATAIAIIGIVMLWDRYQHFLLLFRMKRNYLINILENYNLSKI